ncbi:MAG: hypothetical protein V4538_15225 [Bacteroidota bacterium]
MADEEAKAANQKHNFESLVIPTDILPEEKEKKVYNVLFKLIKKRRGRVYLDNCCDNIPNPKNDGNPERIWLLNGARSIWDSDLEYILKDKSRYDRARRGMDIKFTDSVCMVQSTDTLRLEFMRKNSNNVGKKIEGRGGKYDYYEYDPAQEQKERHAKQLMKIGIITKVNEMPTDKIRKLASFLGISFVDELGMPVSDEGVKTELMIKADTDPATVQKYMDSREVEVAYLVKRAIIDAKIDLGGQNGNAIWAGGKGFIAKIPTNRKPYEYLTELAMTNSDEGRNFKQQLEQMIT